MGRWEHKIVDLTVEIADLGKDVVGGGTWAGVAPTGDLYAPEVQVLNELSDDGWELIAVRVHMGLDQATGDAVSHELAYLRREMPAWLEQGVAGTVDKEIQGMKVCADWLIGLQAACAGFHRNENTDEQVAELVTFLNEWKPYVDRVGVEAGRLSERLTETIKVIESGE